MSEAQHSTGNVFDSFAEQAVKTAQTHQYEGDGNKKLFGLFEMDSMIVDWTNKLWPILADSFNTKYARQSYQLVEKYGHQWTPLHGTTLNRVAAGTTLALNFGMTAAPRIGQFINAMGEQRQHNRDIVQKIAPELDAIKGRHSVGSYHAIRKADNEVIYAYRRRKNAEYHTSNLWNMIAMGVVGAPNLWSQRDLTKGITEGKHFDEAALEGIQSAAGKAVTAGDLLGGGSGKAIANVGIASIIDGIRDKKIKHITSSRDKHCALDMIVELARQSDDNPEARSFRTPGGSECDLERYIIAIAHQHQKDMSALDPEYTLIRKALEEDLKVAVKPVAEAIKNGDISALSLVRLIGEGHIVKNKGRAIADPEVIKETVSKYAGKTRQQFDVDLKDYLGDKNFSEKDAVKMLKSYEGEERIMLGAFLPDQIAEDAKLSEAEREAIGKYRAAHMNEAKAGLIKFLNAKTDDELKEQNLGSADIRHLRETAKKVDADGEAAIKKGGSGKNVDSVIMNWAMPQILGEKAHFGALVESGQAKTEAKPAHHAKHEGTHAEKHEGHKEHRERVSHDREHVHAHEREV